MKTITSTNPLETFGINILTGESCAFGMRLLCDLNEDGQALMRTFLGLPFDARFSSNWNSMVNGKPAVGSTMIARETIPALIRFALWREGFDYIYGYEGSWDCTGITNADIEANPYIKDWFDPNNLAKGARLWRNPSNPAQPSIGTRNIHGFTGRTE